MREKPDLPDEKIISGLRDDFALNITNIEFLPIGNDRNTAVYRAIAKDETQYFVKLRLGNFDETSVTLPKLLSDQGIAQIIPPLPTRKGRVWANLDTSKLILYPFIEGRNVFEIGLSDHQWREFGTALKSIHTAVMPPDLIGRIRRETYSPKWRENVKKFMERVESDSFDDPISAETAAFLKSKRDEVLDLVGRAERLAQALQSRTPEFALCHSDIHAANIHVQPSGAFYIVDWDDPILAPKERDLMFIGGGLMGSWRALQEEQSLFYRGYGETQLDQTALAYYRCERIAQDISEYCEQIFYTEGVGEDRKQAIERVKANFRPNGTLEIAYRSDKTRK